MPTVTIRLSALQNWAHMRPPGYVEDVVSRSRLRPDGKLELPIEEYEALRAKYDSQPPGGAGTELKAILNGMGFKRRKGCKCERRARFMDRMGVEWCLQNIDTIVGWLREEHGRKKTVIPFMRLAAEQLVRLAIRRARKKGNR